MADPRAAGPSATPGGYSMVPIEVEDYELASARLQWARQAACLHLPAQREAFSWHLACCEAALAALSRGRST